MRVLCVAEKPSQAKEIAGKLSDGTANKRSGASRFCSNFDFTFHWRNQQCEFVVTSLIGHVQGLDFASEYKSWYSTHPRELFHLPVFKNIAADKKDVAENIKSEARRADYLMIWTDCDREGENIGAEAVEIATSVNSRLRVLRAQFSVMQARELKYACHNPRSLDQKLVNAVEARTEVDLRIGASLTRFLTLTLKQSFQSLESKLISYGSCQFPTLGFIVDRYIKIRDFVPEEYFRIVMSYIKDDINVTFHWSRGQLFDSIICLALYEQCIENFIATVVSSTSNPTSKWRPLPLTTVELQKLGSKWLRLSSDKVMEAANSLYQKGFISYPRTETDIFDSKFELKPLIEKQTLDSRWANYSQGLLGGKYQFPRSGKNNDGSHPPIHPTAAAPALSGDEAKVYEFVVRRFLAACSQDAKGLKRVVEVEVAQERFTAKGLTVLEYNYLEIYIYEKWSDQLLPNFEVGERFHPSVLDMVNSFTQPPQLLTEAELITIMARNGIGTDATIHEHIRKVLTRDYVYKDRSQRFAPTDLGVGLVEGCTEIGFDKSLSKPFLRRELEISLQGICDGTKDKDHETRQAIQMYLEMFEKAIENRHLLIQALSRYLPINSDATSTDLPSFMANPIDPVTKCPSCNKNMSIRCSQNRWYLGCSGYPACRTSTWFPVDKFSKVELTTSNCPRCPTTKLLKLTVIGSLQTILGEEYSGCIRCDDLLANSAGVRLRPATTSSHSTTTQSRPSTTQSRPIATQSRPNNTPSHISTTHSQFTNSAPVSRPPTAFPTVPESTSDLSALDALEQFRLMSMQSNSVVTPQCRCGRFAVRKQATGQGANQGKWYFACSSASRNCNFFQWMDGDAPVPPSYPNSNNTRSAPQVVCFRCEQPGHFANSCPQHQGNPTNSTRNDFRPTSSSGGGGGGANGMKCFRCNQPGHFAPNCPNKGSNPPSNGTVPSSVVCFKCNQPGHFASNCSNPSTGGGGVSDSILCFKCNQPGHISTNCPSRPSGGGVVPDSIVCFKCGQPGHFAPSCPEAPPSTGTTTSRGRVRARGRGRGTSSSSRRGTSSKGTRSNVKPEPY